MLSHRALAEFLGIPKGTVTRWLNEIYSKGLQRGNELCAVTRLELVRAAKDAGANHKDAIFMAQNVPKAQILSGEESLSVTPSCVVRGGPGQYIVSSTCLVETVDPQLLGYRIERYKTGKEKGETERKREALAEYRRLSEIVYRHLDGLVGKDSRQSARNLIQECADLLYGGRWKEAPQVQVDDDNSATRYVNARTLFEVYTIQLEKLLYEDWDNRLDGWEWNQFGRVEPTLENRIARIRELIEELQNIRDILREGKNG